MNPLKARNIAGQEDYTPLIVSSPPKLQFSSHPALDSLSALFLALDSNEFVRQPSNVRTSRRSYVLRAREAVLQFLSHGINAVDQDILLSTPDDDPSDDFVEVREPVFRCQQRLCVVVVRCRA